MDRWLVDDLCTFCAGLPAGGGELQPNSGNESGIVSTSMTESEKKILSVANRRHFLMDNMDRVG